MKEDINFRWALEKSIKWSRKQRKQRSTNTALLAHGEISGQNIQLIFLPQTTIEIKINLRSFACNELAPKKVHHFRPYL